MSVITVLIKTLEHGKGLPVPSYATENSAAMDLYAAVEESMTIAPNSHAKIPTGIALELPTDCELQIRPRSGLAAKHGITVLNSPATIDADYRGEIFVLLVNLGQKPHTIHRGDRIAQMLAVRLQKMEVRREEPSCAILCNRNNGDKI